MSNLEPPDGPDDLEIEQLRQELAAVERVAELRSELEAARAERECLTRLDKVFTGAVDALA